MKLLAAGLTFFAAGLISMSILLCGGIINPASTNMEPSTWIYVINSKQAMPFFVLNVVFVISGFLMTIIACIRKPKE